MTKTLIAFAISLILAGCASVPGNSILGVETIFQCKDVDSHFYEKDKIVGGERVAFGDPDEHLVTMLTIHRSDHDSICTGTLISDRVVLTAAHCVYGVDAGDIQARFVTKTGCPVNQQRELGIDANKFVIDEKFDGTPQSLSDLALIKLDEKAPPEQVRVPILEPNETPSSDRLLLIGFGITGERQKDSQILRRVYKDRSKDLSRNEHALIIDQKNGEGFCRGDSGAPILAEIYLAPRVIGVNSANAGIELNRECHTLSIAMDTQLYAPWIKSNRDEFERKSWWRKLWPFD